MKRFLFFAVTKGHVPGVYTSWEEANEQVLNFIHPEFHCFNSYEQATLCFKARIYMISLEKAATSELSGNSREASSQKLPLLCGGARRRPVVTWLPVIPGEELNGDFAIVSDMEEWLLKACYEAKIPGPCFFKQERFLRDDGPYFGFTVVVPGDPFEIPLSVKRRFSLNEKAAREDAALEMLDRVVELSGKEIRDFNYSKVKLLRDSNSALRAKVGQLEDAYEKLMASYESLLNAHIEGQSP
ncbi:hypothetical protein HN51_067028 [Arachis hypogaea]|nr:uncharacterized protein LOC107638014 [Arachis ipaensis]XP_025645019.1 uncharacterized protein LOC112740588 [Arachis hypogaea]QHO08426.1 uncharacterized protein DS421_14g472520 [Arachis hypogaea]